MKNTRRFKLREFFIEYGIHIFLLFFFVNLVLAWVFHYYVSATGCMTTQQVQTDNRCLYIWNNQVFYIPGVTKQNPHHGHPCGTDVTSTHPPTTHFDGRLLPGSPFNIASVCTSNITPTPTPTNTPTPTPNPTPSPTPKPTNTPTPTPTNTPTPTPSSTPTPTPTPKPTNTPTSTSNPTPTPTPTLGLTKTPAPTNTIHPTPTLTPTSTPTSKPTPTPTLIAIAPSLTQTATPTPTTPVTNTQTPVPSLSPLQSPTAAQITQTPTPPTTLTINLSLALPGISDGGNPSPKHTTRNATVYLYNVTDNIQDPSVTPFSTASDTVTYDTSSKNFTNQNFNLGNVPAGQYQLIVKLNQFMQQKVINPSDSTSVFNLVSGQATQLPLLALVPGDINPSPNGNNIIDVNDYNDIINCYAGKSSSPSCADKSAVDLNDDGIIDGIDYNLFLIGLRQYLVLNNLLPTTTPSVTPTQTPTATPSATLSPTSTPTNTPIPTSIPSISPTNMASSITPTTIPSPTFQPTITPKSTPQTFFKTIVASLTNSTFLTKTLDVVVILILGAVLVVGILRSKFLQKIINKKQEGKTAPKNNVFDKTCFVTPVSQANGTMELTLVDDDEHITGYYKGADITKGFLHVKGTRETDANGKPYVSVSELKAES